ncbi:MAG: hypothetical protein AABY33_02545 [Pseudomonadota bacterium]
MIVEHDLFEDVEKFVKDSRNLIANGSAVEMAGLDRQVQSLCSHILGLSQDDRIKYADLLQNLLAELQSLSIDLTTQREALAHEIRYLSSHKKANVAYKTADGKAVSLDEEGN